MTADAKQQIKENSWRAKFVLANNNYRYDEVKKEYQQNTGFFDVTVFGKENERMISKLKKGIRIGVNGRLNMVTKIDKAGEKKKQIEIVCFTIQILDPTAYKEEKDVSDDKRV